MSVSQSELDALWIEATTPERWYPSSPNPDSGPVVLVEPAVLQRLLVLARSVHPEERRTIEHLQMQIGYLATALMVQGDKRSLPEIVEEAERATGSRPQLDKGNKK